MKGFCKKYFSLIIVAIVMAITTIASFADVTTPTSMLDPAVSSQIANLAADLKPTILAMIAIIIPAGLAIWAIGFGIKKGLGVLKGQAKKAV